MGRYADPQIIVDKSFEKVRGELDKLYKNVDNNLQLIAKRKQARKAAQAKKYGSFGDVYNKAVKDSRASSRKFARTRPDMAKDAKKQFSDQIASRFDEGYDNIQAFVRGQYISKEGEEPIKNPTESQINAFVQSQIDAANDLGESLVAFEGLANAHAKGIKAGDGSNGKNTGSVVVGSEFSNIFNAMTGDTEGQEDIQWSKMKLSGSLTGGTTIYFDGQSENEEGFGVADKSEIIDLSKMKTNYINGNQEVYFQNIKDKSEVAKDMGPIIKTAQNNKAVDMFKIYNVTGPDGVPFKMKVLNEKKTQDYFINGEGAAVTVDAMIEKHGGIDAAVQAYFGADVAAKFPEKGTEGYDQAMLKLKTRLYEDLDPLISDGDKDMLSPNKETTSRQYTKDTNSKVVKGFYEEVHGEVGRLLPTLPGDKEAMNKFNLYIQNRPYSQGGTTYTIDHMEPVSTGSSDMVLVMKNGNKIKPEEGYFKLNDLSGRRKLEQGLMKGNFQGTTDRKHVDGFYNSDEFGGEVEGVYNGSEKESVRITSTETQGGISYEEYMQKVEGSEKPLNSNTIDWPWETDGLGGGSQAAVGDTDTDTDNSIQAQLGIQPQASATTGTVNQAEEMKGTQVKTQDISGATNAAKPDDEQKVKYADLSTPVLDAQGQPTGGNKPNYNNFGGKEYDESDRIGDKAVYTTDASGTPENTLDNQYRKIINFESVAGGVKGGVGDYGFTDSKYNGKEPKSPEEAVKMIKTEIVPEVETELGFSIDDLKGPPQVTASLVDYKMNTGRKMNDLLVIAYQNQQAIEGKTVEKTWDGISASRNYSPKPSKEVYDALKSGGISAEAIAAAKDELYLGRIKEMMNMVEKDPNAKDKNGRLIKDKLGNAKTAYKNSHSNRVNMFK